MAGTTGIGWTDATLNLWTWRCAPVVDECDDCYAEIWTNRWQGPGAFRDGPPVLKPGRLLLPWLDPNMRAARRNFLTSMSDPFHPGISLADQARVWAMMAADRTTDWPVLTKRPDVMLKVLTNPEFPGMVQAAMPAYIGLLTPPSGRLSPERKASIARIRAAIDAFEWPLPNVWLGVSAGQQDTADAFLPALMEAPAAVRILSCEPMIGPVDVTKVRDRRRNQPDRVLDLLNGPDGLDWVIIGGESGQRTIRAMHPGWAGDLIDQCERAQVPVFFKQWGEWAPAPFIVRVCDPAVGWQGTEEELAAAKKDSEARAATHVHTGQWYIGEDGRKVWNLHEIGHPPWGLERVALPEGMEPMRRWGTKAAGNTIGGRVLEQFPASRRWT